MNVLRLTLGCASAACVLILTTRQNAALDTSAEAAKPAVEEAAPQPPPIDFLILEQRQIRVGDRSVILNRVAPPVLPLIAAPIVPVATVLSPEAEEELQAREKKAQVMLFLGVTVYDQRVTELQWSSAGRTFSAWSSIDFNDIAGMGGFETDEILCSLMIGIGNETSAALAETNRDILARGLPQSLIKTLPTADKFTQARSTYFFSGDNGAESCDPNILSALDALHVYYDAHREELHRAFLEREARRLETEQWEKEHPPVPKDTVINYWIGQGGATTTIPKRRVGGGP